MAQVDSDSDILQFKNGLVSDATLVNSVPDSCSKLENFVRMPDGSIQNRRRLVTTGQNHNPAISLSGAGTTVNTGGLDWAIWENASNSGETLLVRVLQMENRTAGASFTAASPEVFIYFYRLSDAGDIPVLNTYTPGDAAVVGVYRGPRRVTAMKSIKNFFAIAATGMASEPALSGTAAAHNPGILLYRYDAATGNVTQIGYREPKIRDTQIVADEDQIEEGAVGRSSGITSDYIYDLFNAGWDGQAIREFVVGSPGNVYPGYGALQQAGVYETSTPGTFAFSASKCLKNSDGNSIAGRGRVWVPPVNPNWQRRNIADNSSRINKNQAWGSDLTIPSITGSNIENFHDTLTDGYPRARIISLEEYAGRLFYLFIVEDGDPLLREYGTAFICFSQLGSDEQALTRCGTVNDPTSATVNTPGPADGGYIPLNVLGTPIALKRLQDDLIIFTTKEVYIIKTTGGQFDPSAGNFVLSKISENVTIAWDETTTTFQFHPSAGYHDIVKYSPTNMIQVNNELFFLSVRGVERLSPREQTDTLTTVPLTEGRLNKFFAEIPQSYLARAVPFYVASANTIVWLYSDKDLDEASSPYAAPLKPADMHNSALIFDLTTGDFKTFKFGNDGATDAVVFYPGFAMNHTSMIPWSNSVSYTNEAVSQTADSERTLFAVYGADPQDVYWHRFTHQDENQYTQDFTNLDGTDIIAGSGVDYSALLQTNAITQGETARPKSMGHLTVHLERAETATDVNGDFTLTGSCKARVAWDSADFTTGTKFLTNEYQLYRLPRLVAVGSSSNYDFGPQIITSKTKFLGRGRSFRFQIRSEQGKLTRLHGYAYTVKIRREAGK